MTPGTSNGRTAGLNISNEAVIAVKGAGDIASGIAWRLHRAGFGNIYMMDKSFPLAVRRTVCFCEAIHEGTMVVEGIGAARAESTDDVFKTWQNCEIAVAADPDWRMMQQIRPHIVIDAILAKKNLGTSMADAPLVIGLGPGFTAGKDVHRVVETKRGHYLGRVIEQGGAIPNTGIPGSVNGYSFERVLRAPIDGVFETDIQISEAVDKDQAIGHVEGEPVISSITGMLRGLIRTGTRVPRGLKIGDVDPRADKDHCYTISDKARAIGGGVLETILRGSTAP